MTRILLLISMLVLAAGAVASPSEFSVTTPEVQHLDEVLLKDGTMLSGHVIEIRDDVIIFDSGSLGIIEIPQESIVRIARATDRSGVLTDPDFNSLMFCPTPATLAKGDAYFRDFELFFLNFGYAFSDDFNVSFGTLFPISADVIMLSLGGKLKLIDREEKPVGLALVGSYTLLEDVHFGSLGVVAGIGDAHNSLNVTVNHTYDDDGDTENVFLIGTDAQLTRRSKFFLEYMSSSTLLEEDDDLKGFINLGFRIFGDSHSFSLSGFRPLTDDGGSFIAFPMLMYSNHW